MHKQLLNGEWQLSFTPPGEEQPRKALAPVPGNVEPVLQKLGLVTDYMPPDHPHATTPFTAVDDWQYMRVFEAPPLPAGWRRELVFEGIDTLGEVYLNGERILDVCNMHLTYRADVTHRLRAGANELCVRIRSSELWARELPRDLFVEQAGDPGFYESRAFLRKARHQWGWDNAPRLLTVGIIKDVYLVDLPPNRFEDIYLYTRSITAELVTLGVNFHLATDRPYLDRQQIRFSLSDGERVVFSKEFPLFFVQGKCTCKIPREAVELWWPAGFGKQMLYTALLEFLEDGEVLAAHRETIGIRTVRLENTGDITATDGGSFQFYVNDQPVFLRGTNWKPLDPLASEAHRKTAAGVALPLLTDLHCNAVRIWGGGIYEDHPFFDFCDRNGILVWQDFMLACEIPTLDPTYGALVAAEAEQTVKRLRRHPSLAIWCGDNENDQFLAGLHQYNDILPSQVRINREILKQAVLRFDPYRPYVESSPLVTDRCKRQKLLSSAERAVWQTEEHLYAAPTEYSKKLRACRSIFLGETGPFYVNAATVNPRILAREANRAARLWDAPKIHSGGYHQNDGYFTDWRTKGQAACLAFFGRDFAFSEFRNYALAINLICGEIFKDVIEYSRTARPRKTGVLWWSLYDMWPMLFNYSVVDCDGHRKLPYYWIRSSQQEVALMAVRTDEGAAPVLHVANDTLQNVAFSYTVTAYSAAGEAKEIACGQGTARANSVAPLLTLATPAAPELWVIRWQMGDRICANHFFTDKASFETYRRWANLLARDCGFAGELAELP